jgi:hypothetical protein
MDSIFPNVQRKHHDRRKKKVTRNIVARIAI